MRDHAAAADGALEGEGSERERGEAASVAPCGERRELGLVYKYPARGALIRRGERRRRRREKRRPTYSPQRVRVVALLSKLRDVPASQLDEIEVERRGRDQERVVCQVGDAKESEDDRRLESTVWQDSIEGGKGSEQAKAHQGTGTEAKNPRRALAESARGLVAPAPQERQDEEAQNRVDQRNERSRRRGEADAEEEADDDCLSRGPRVLYGKDREARRVLPPRRHGAG